MTLDSIIERLEKAQGGDRELDFWISVRVYDPCEYTVAELQADIDSVGIEGMHIDAAFTSSVDAAIALARKLFPDCTISSDSWPEKAHVAICAGPTPSAIVEGEGHHSSQAIATVIATLKAKQMGVGE